ncbi:Jerky -like protein-like [Trichinella zimbabwensis]|uniref:Jerky-like protein-like n=1 Tax=Trichinella zimbabwensis TaxID=268475 RepID=A0A0V1H5Z0_9BILA|nr:Jerky -like protein-like [Trichinella zimbabwensis]
MSGMSTSRKRKVLSLEQKLKPKRPRAMIGVQKLPEYQQKTKRSEKLLLIIDDVPCYPSCELLDRENGFFFKVLFLPLNTSSLVQPMDKTEGTLVNAQEILRNVNLKDSCYMIAQAWNSISGSTLRILSDELPGYDEKCVNQSIDCDDYCITVIAVEKDENEEVDVSDKPNKGVTHSEAYS